MSRTCLIVSVIFIVILGLLAAPAAWAGGLKTGTPVSLAGGAGGDAVLLVDLNGDGIQDLVVADCSLSQIEIFQGNGSGGFAAAPVSPVGIAGSLTNCPRALAADTVTKGSFPDIVVADSDGKVTVLANPGTLAVGSIVPAASLVLPAAPNPANASGVAIVDFDGDTNLDVAVTDSANAKVYVLLGNGNIALTLTPAGPFTVGTNPVAVGAGDGDGTLGPDMAVVNKGSGTVTVLLSNQAGWPVPGSVSFSTATVTVGSGPVAIAGGFLGSSGKPDLAVVNQTDSSVSVLLNNGSGVFTASTTAIRAAQSPTGVVIGDFNNDGFQDVVVSAADGAEILFNNGAGVLTLSPDVFPAGTGPAGIAIGGINSDARADVAIVNDTSDDVSILLSTPFSNITSVPVAPNPIEGAPFGPVNLLTFKYDGSPATTNFSADVDWGDGNPTTAGTVSLAAGTYTVQGSYTYAEHTPFPSFCGGNPTCSINITVNNTTDGYTETGTSSADVDDAALTPIAVPDPVATQDTAVPLTAVIAKFSDANPGGVDTDFDDPLSTVDYGDGTTGTCSTTGGTANCTIAADVAPGTFKVTPNHTYATRGIKTITVNMHDVGGSSTGPMVTHASITRMSLNSSNLPFNATETQPFSPSPHQLGQFTTSRGGAKDIDFSVVINWGDGSPNTTCTTGNGAGGCVALGLIVAVGGGGGAPFNLFGGHTYSASAPATETVTVTITDPSDSSSTLTLTGDVSIVEAPLVKDNVAISAQNVTEGTSASFTAGRFWDEDQNSNGSGLNITIHWGDGTSDSSPSPNVTLSGPTPGTDPNGKSAVKFTVSGNHTYAKGGLAAAAPCVAGSPATCQITVDITDPDAGGSSITTDPAQVNVADATLAGTPFPINAGLIGTDVFTGTVATWVDNNPLATDLTDYGVGSVTIDFQDGAAVMVCTKDSDNPIPTPALAPETCKYFIDSGNANTKTVIANHAYLARPTADQSKVTITNAGGNSVTVTDTVTSTTIGSVVGPALGAQKEGIAFGPVTVGTFTSGRAGAVAADFNTSFVAWGDGTQDTCNGANCSVSGSFPNFTISGSHTYAEGGLDATGTCVPGTPASCTPSIHIVDSVDASTASANGTVTVADGALAPGLVGAIGGGPHYEGNPTGTITVGTFTDENPNFVPADFPSDLTHVKITWGDASSSAGAVADGGCSSTPIPPYSAVACNTPGAFHVYNVTGSHTYAEGGLDAPAGGLYNISIDILDTGGSQVVGFASASIQIDDAPLSNLVVNTLTGGSGQGGAIVANFDTFTGAVATFQDGNPNAPTSDFSGTIDWGDGSVPTAFTSADVSGGGGSYTISSSHMFTKAGTQLTGVTVTVNDVGGSSIGPVAGTAANVTSLHLPTPANLTPVEGLPFSGAVGTFTATTGNSNFSATINWGDGNSNAATSITGGPAWTVNGSNTYVDENPILCGAGCAITINITDNTDGSLLTISGGIADVKDASLTVLPAGAIVASAGQPITGAIAAVFQDGNPLATPADFTGVVVHWNDPVLGAGPSVAGTVQQIATPPGSPTQFQIIADYPAGYSINGNYQVTFDVADVGAANCEVPGQCAIVGGAGAAVSNSPGILTAIPANLTLQSGSLTYALDGPIGGFTNTNPALPASNYTGTVDWGDGTPLEVCSDVAVTCTIVALSPGNFEVRGTHTYLLLGQTFPVTITINDAVGGGSVVINSSVNVPNVAPTDFLGNASPPQSQIRAGQVVDLLVTLSPNPNQGPYNSPVTFTGCTILPSDPVPPALTGLTCTFSPSSVPDVTQVRQVHVFVHTFANSAMQSAPPLSGRHNLTQLALLLPGFVGVFGMVLLGGSRKSRRRTALWFGASLLLLTFLLVGCGGTGLTPPNPGIGGTQPGTYRLQINTNVGAATGPCAINGTGPCLTAQVTVTQ